MTIRSKLLWLLLPPLIAFVTMISLFFYYNWQREIITSFQSYLKAIVVAASHSLPSDTLNTLFSEDLTAIEQNPQFKKLNVQLQEIKEALALESLYLVKIEHVRKGEAVRKEAPAGPDNPRNDGHDPSLAFRQIYLLDAATEALATPHHRHPGDSDFSESGEHSIYLTKKTLVTDGYLSRYGAEKIMTAYAPIIDSQGNVIALIGTDISLASVDAKLSKAAWVIALSAIATLALVIISVFSIAHKISVPVQKVNNAALEIAAGRYGYSLTIDGPKEIRELANTLNTMSECLEENIERQQQKSAVRERLFGEYECSLMLLEKMFDAPIAAFKDPALLVSAFKTNSAMVPHGVYAQIAKEPQQDLIILSFLECFDSGFNAMFDMLQRAPQASERQGQVTLAYSIGSRRLSCQRERMPMPLHWSAEKLAASWVEDVQECQSGDLILLCSRSFDALFAAERQKEQWFARLMNHFAQEEFELLSVMMQQELRFLCETPQFEKDLFLILLKIS